MVRVNRARVAFYNGATVSIDDFELREALRRAEIWVIGALLERSCPEPTPVVTCATGWTRPDV
jgi:hypothetical protein